MIGFKKICEDCGGDKFRVYWDIRQQNCACHTSPVTLQCVKCKTTYDIYPEPTWRIDKIDKPEIQLVQVDYKKENDYKKEKKKC